MKNKRIVPVFLLIIFELAALGVSAQGQDSPTAAAELKEVNVYFLFIGKDGTESKILPLKRKVNRLAPLRPAIEALLAPPTPDEQKLGYQSAAYGDMKLASVRVDAGSGTARIDFSRPVRADYNPGDLQTLNFESAVKRTAEQFSTVKKVLVCVNGMNEFGIGMVIDAPAPCPK